MLQNMILDKYRLSVQEFIIKLKVYIFSLLNNRAYYYHISVNHLTKCICAKSPSAIINLLIVGFQDNKIIIANQTENKH